MKQQFHPNMVPVTITNPQQLRNLAEDMKRAAIDEPDVDSPEYSDSPEEMIERQERINADEQQFNELMRHTRFIMWSGHLCSLSLTLDKYEEPHRWHLSMCEQRPDPTSKQGASHHRIPDKVAEGVSNVMLGRECKEIPNPSKGIPEIRHFVIDMG